MAGSIGIAVTKDQVNATAGSLALDLKDTLDKVAAFKEWLDGQSEAALIELGFDAQQVAVLKSAYSDAAQLAEIFFGRAGLDVRKDFRPFLKQLYGIGRR